MGQYEVIAIERLRPARMNPRKSIEKTALEELAASIKSIGIINPITVRKAADEYEIISGERRYTAAKMVGLKEVPVITKDISEAEMLEIQIIENLQRKDIHPLDEAFGFEQLLASGLYSNEGISEKIGKSLSYITRRLHLLNLNKEIQDAFLEEKITLGHALELCRLNAGDQKQAFKYLKDSMFTRTAKNLHWHINENFFRDLSRAVFDTASEDLGTISCQACPKRTGFNKTLFDDILNADYCTDGSCYSKKVDVHIPRMMELEQSAGREVIKITTRSNSKDPEAKRKYTLDYFDEGEDPKCEHTVKGIITETDKYDKYQLGSIYNICTNPDCPVHHSKNADQPAMSEDEKDEAERSELSEELQDTTVRLTNLFLLNEYMNDWDLDGAVDVIFNYIRDYTYLFDSGFFERKGINNKDKKKCWEKLLDGITMEGKIELILDGIFHRDFFSKWVQGGPGATIRKTSEAMGIDVKGIESAIKKEIIPDRLKELNKKMMKKKKEGEIPENKDAA